MMSLFNADGTMLPYKNPLYKYGWGYLPAVPKKYRNIIKGLL